MAHPLSSSIDPQEQGLADDVGGWLSPKEADEASFDALISHLDYLPSEDVDRVRASFRFADEAHLGQFRRDGSPYVTHCIAVARICAQWKLDTPSIMAALVHDVLQDCGVTKGELLERFDREVADLAWDVTRSDQLDSLLERVNVPALRELILTLAADIRVMLIKLADRLQNLRSLDQAGYGVRRQRGAAAMLIYAPIALRLGFDRAHKELEDLAFKNMHPWRYEVIRNAQARVARSPRVDMIERVIAGLQDALRNAQIEATVTGREKSPWSIYRKMRAQHHGFAQVQDLLGFRIVVDSVDLCYCALAPVHAIYRPVPGHFYDGIALPKSNGYQSLHTLVMNPLGTAMEIQIRSKSMHESAELGPAAHWRYKTEGTERSGPGDYADGLDWLREILRGDTEPVDRRFLGRVKVNLATDRIYVFTPEWSLCQLPAGSTVVDFAYLVHSQLGDCCTGARVNDELVGPTYRLKSGDVVQITASADGSPNRSWLDFAKSTKARRQIRALTRPVSDDEALELGAELLSKALGPNWSSDDVNQTTWRRLARWFGYETQPQLLMALGHDETTVRDVARQFWIFDAKKLSPPTEIGARTERLRSGITVGGVDGDILKIASCCLPIPGDRIQGLVDSEDGTVVHTQACSIGRERLMVLPRTAVRASWAEAQSTRFDAFIAVVLKQADQDIDLKLLRAIDIADAEVRRILWSATLKQHSNGPLYARIHVSVWDRQNLANVLRCLRSMPEALRVLRIKP